MEHKHVTIYCQNILVDGHCTLSIQQAILKGTGIGPNIKIVPEDTDLKKKQQQKSKILFPSICPVISI